MGGVSTDEDPIGFINRKQGGIIEDGCVELQLEMKELAGKAGIADKTLFAYKNGQNTLSLWAVKRLLRVPGMAPILSRLFAPEGYELRKVGDDFCPHAAAADAADYLREYAGHATGPLAPHQMQRLAEKHGRLRLCFLDVDGDVPAGLLTRALKLFRGR